MTAVRPVPVPDARTADYWSAAGRHVLALPRCTRCYRFALPPGETCRRCGTSTPEFRYEPVSGRGTVRSWTVVRKASLLGFADQVPYLLVDVELAEERDLRMIGRLLNGPETVMHVGDPVRVAFEDLTDELSVPAFVLATSGPSGYDLAAARPVPALVLATSRQSTDEPRTATENIGATPTPPHNAVPPRHPGAFLAGIHTLSAPTNVVDSGQMHAGMTDGMTTGMTGGGRHHASDLSSAEATEVAS